MFYIKKIKDKYIDDIYRAYRNMNNCERSYNFVLNNGIEEFLSIIAISELKKMEYDIFYIVSLEPSFEIRRINNEF